MYYDSIRCRNCHTLILFRPSKPQLPHTGPTDSEAETESAIVSCFRCKHVYDYRDQPIEALPASWPQFENRPTSPVLFSVVLGCDDEDCDKTVIALAPRVAGTTGEDLEAEYADWTLCDLRCPARHPIVHVHYEVGPEEPM